MPSGECWVSAHQRYDRAAQREALRRRDERTRRMKDSVTYANANGVGLRTSEAPFAAADGYAAPIDPACGSGNFLASALGIYFTPQHVLDALNKSRLDKICQDTACLGNPPFGTYAKRHTVPAQRPPAKNV